MISAGYRALAAQIRKEGTVVRKTWLDEKNLGRAEILNGTVGFISSEGDHLPQTIQINDETILFERFDHEKILLICGGGHVSVPVCTLGKLLGYHVIVVDERSEFASKERFPEANEVICTDFTSTLNSLNWDTHQDISVVIITRGHVADTECLRHVIRRNLPYIGMIGSKSKNLAVLDVMRREGVSEEQIARVHAPIGLDIGGRTPEEISVSIAAELISERRGKDRSVFSEAMLDALLSEDSINGIMATIVSKHGSTPRDVGARMLFLPNGEVLGTVGGGLPEHLVMEAAKRLLSDPHTVLQHFDMSNGEAGKSGLICGGNVDVLFEVVN